MKYVLKICDVVTYNLKYIMPLIRSIEIYNVHVSTFLRIVKKIRFTIEIKMKSKVHI